MFAVPQGGVTQTASLQCIPKDAELVAYRTQGAGNLSEFLQVVSCFSHTTSLFLYVLNNIAPICYAIWPQMWNYMRILHQ